MSTEKVTNFIIDTNFDSLPLEVISQAKLAVKDHIGVMLAAKEDRAVQAARKYALGVGGVAEATLAGTNNRVSCATAAMVNTIMTRTLDMDDGAYRPTGHLVHAGGVVVPSALAVAERERVTGREFIVAVSIAYEVALRAGWLISLWKMFAPAGMAGTYGAAAAAAKILRLYKEQTQHALGIAEAHCLYPSRAKRFDDMRMTKEAAGWGAMTGVSAALLASAGFEGPDTIFDLEEFNRDPLATLGTEWEIMRLYFKPYSSCRFTHAAIDGVLNILAEYDLQASDVAHIKVGVAHQATSFATYRPESIWQAQFSIPFVVGAALAYGEVSPEQVADAMLRDKAILTQADKVKLAADAEVDSLRPGRVAARVTLTTISGKVIEKFITHPRGEPENPLSMAELDAKFNHLVTAAYSAGHTRELSSILDGLEKVKDIRTLIQRISL